ncbi:group I truncated hemoglobin [Maricaulis parjimensis]|uniref:group I truncated hemoglobin n=1 Tax=Maricaulis parjimensis TaxID=144023 RepID=UPI00193A21A6|nr:group 1 truncated hemoglobin [Maricaulis parjimensis]
MIRHILSASLLIAACCSGAIAQSHPPHAVPGELEVDPYIASDANAGAAPIEDPAVFAAFGGEAGIARVVDGLLERVQQDERIEGIFRASDWPRLRRTLIEQFCYLLGGPCHYTGRDMASVHRDHGITTREFNALVENLQDAMDAEGIPFAMQNRLLARLAPMHRDVVTR